MPVQRATLDSLRQDLKDRWESVPFWSDEEARLALNEALRVWNLFTGTWKRRIVFGMERRTHWFALPAHILHSTRVFFQERPLDRASLFELDYARQNWEAEYSNDGGTVPVAPRKWTPAGLTLIAVWPAVHESCFTLTVDGVANTPILVNGFDWVDIEDSEHSAILGEALYVAAFKEGGSRWESSKRYHDAFLIAAADRNDRIRQSSYFRRYFGLDTQRRSRKIREVPERESAGVGAGAS